MKTYSPKPEHIDRRWYVIDASGAVLGRVASEAATILRGKHKPIFAPHMDTGDHVVIVNAAKVELTGGKETKKISYRHSGYPGGIKGTNYGKLMADKPAFVVEKAIRGMLPKNRLGRAMIKKLHVVAGPEHPHAAQKPVPLAIGERPAWEGLPVKAPEATPEPEARVKKAPAEKKVVAAKKPAAAKKKTTAAKKPAAAAKKTVVSKEPAAAEKTSAKPAAEKTSAAKPAAKRIAAAKSRLTKKKGKEA